MWPYQRQKRQCRNGPGCRFLAQKRCFFAHPPSHSNSQNIQRSSYQRQSQSEHLQSQTIEAILRQIRVQTIRQQISREQTTIDNIQSAFRSSVTRVIEPTSLARTRQLSSMSSLSRLGRYQAPSSRLNPYPEMEKKQKTQLSADKEWFFSKNTKICLKSKEDAEKYETCSICTQNFAPGQSLTSLFCKHHYHISCVEQWFKLNSNCPLCKRDFRKHSEYARWDARYEKRIVGFKDRTEILINNLSIPAVNSAALNSARLSTLSSPWADIPSYDDYENNPYDYEDDLDDPYTNEEHHEFDDDFDEDLYDL